MALDPSVTWDFFDARVQSVDHIARIIIFNAWWGSWSWQGSVHQDCKSGDSAWLQGGFTEPTMGWSWGARKRASWSLLPESLLAVGGAPEESTKGCERQREARRGRPAVTWARQPRAPPSSCACPRASPSGPRGWSPCRTRRRWRASRRCAGTCGGASPSCGWTASGTPRTCTACPRSAWPCAPETKQEVRTKLTFYFWMMTMMERGADWCACEELISTCFLAFYWRECSIWGYFNLSLSSLFILSLPPKLVWINQIPRHLHVVICSVADLSKITKSPGKFHNFFTTWILLDAKLIQLLKA